jgi:hypothetical protein
LKAITAQGQLVEGGGPQYRTASTLVVDSSYPLYRGLRKYPAYRAIAWLSLDHLRLPLDKSPVKKTRRADA